MLCQCDFYDVNSTAMLMWLVSYKCDSCDVNVTVIIPIMTGMLEMCQCDCYDVNVTVWCECHCFYVNLAVILSMWLLLWQCDRHSNVTEILMWQCDMYVNVTYT